MFARGRQKGKEKISPAAADLFNNRTESARDGAVKRSTLLQPGVSVSIEKPYGGFTSSSGYEMKRRPTRYDRFGGLRLRGKRRGWNTFALATMVICTCLFLYQDILEMLNLLRSQEDMGDGFVVSGQMKDKNVLSPNELNAMGVETSKADSNDVHSDARKDAKGNVELGAEKSKSEGKSKGPPYSEKQIQGLLGKVEKAKELNLYNKEFGGTLTSSEQKGLLMHYFAARAMEGPTKDVEVTLTNGRFSKKKFNGKRGTITVPENWPDTPWHEWPVGLVQVRLIGEERAQDPLYWEPWNLQPEVRKYVDWSWAYSDGTEPLT